jgi:hypothetical protein
MTRQKNNKASALKTIMKTLNSKILDRIPMRKHILTAAACLFSGILTSSASVTVQGWWHYGEVPDYYADSSGHAYRFQSAFSRVGSGNAGAGVEPFGCGGPLGDTGFTSTSCLYWTPTHADAAGMWDPGNTSVPSYNPPGSNYVIELWCLPTYPGTLGGNGAWLFCSGTSGGATFVLTNDGVENMTIAAQIVPVTGGSQIGDSWAVDTNRWTHLAIVNDNGTNTFYVNGVQHGASADPSLSTAPAGTIYAGSASGTQPTYEGYLDELRISTFSSGQFSTTDLMTRAMSPDIVSQPPPESVWNGGAAPFTVGVAIDTSTTYQWQNAGVNIDGATNSELYLNTVTSGSNGAQFSCVLNNYTGIAVTSSVTTLTVVAPSAADVAAYRTAVTAEPGLVAYYTVDNDTGTTLTDTKGSNNGTLEGTAEFDGRTNYAFGVRALRLKNTDDGDVTIPNNPAFEFGSGTGTIEAMVHLDQALSQTNETIFSEANVGNPIYYAIQVSPDGSSLIYTNDLLTKAITWAVPVPLVGRLAHVAVVFTNSTVTAYADGLSLGSQANPSFGSIPGGPAWIGSAGGLFEPGEFTGTIDEIAVYTSALSANTIAIHNSKFLFGTNTSSPSITASPTGSKTLLAGGLASFTVTASGTAPLSYQWTTNTVPIPGATAATLTLSPSTTNQSGTYGVTVSNPYGSTNSPTFDLTFVAPTDHYATMIMGDNPMAYWRLDETNGTTAFDSAGGHDGTYSGSLTLGASGALPGDSDTAVHFSGGHVLVPYTPVLNPGSAFTVEFWANTDVDALQAGATYVPMGSQFRNGGGRDGWAFYDNNDGNGWELQMGDPSGVAYYAYGSAEALGNYWYYVAAIWDGNSTLSLYAENQLVGQNTQVQNGGVYVPNPSQPLIIGNRNDFNFPFAGLMDEVAFYNYALSADQISNHWSIKFVASRITQEPLGVTNSEGSTITLTVGASGFPNTYQWFFDGNPLSATANFDGTAHYPNGVNSSSLVIAEAKPSDSGEYFLGVTNGLGDSVSSNATVLVTANTVPPAVESVTALGTPNTSSGTTNPSVVKVVFSARVDASTGGNSANYAFSPPVTINRTTLLGSGPNDLAEISLGADWREAILVTAGLTPGQKYSLTVSGVKDQSQTPLTMPTSTNSFRAPVRSTGAVNWDYYYLGGTTGGAVSALTGDVNYGANAPQTNSYFTAFDSSQITGGDLNNNPAFGALGDEYGDVVSGWITPTVSGDYTFFLSSDDGSELDLSTDANPANATPIAYEAAYQSGFTEPTNAVDYDSSPITLVAGHSYYIQALHVEGSGGDYIKVAWRISTDSTPAKNLTPIPGSFLSSYQPVAAPQFSAPVLTNGTLTLDWSGSGATIQQSTDLLNWTNVPGNPSPLILPVNSGTNTLFFRLKQ